MIKSVCVYCGSSARVDDIYKNAAIETGEIIVRSGWDVVYGGGKSGLMGIVANTAMDTGGKVTGVMVESLTEYELQHEGLTKLHIVPTMHERKQMMVDLADAFVILPGGLGTLDEFFEIITWKQIGLHAKPIIIVNLDGYWDHLNQLIDHIADKAFMRRASKEYLFTVVDKVSDIQQAINDASALDYDPTGKWK